MMNKALIYIGNNVSGIVQISREGGWILVGQISTVLGSLVLVRVLTEQLDPAQYGHLALALTVAGLINQVVMGGINNGIGRFYSIAVEKSELTCYLEAAKRLVGYATLAAVVIMVVLMLVLIVIAQDKWLGLANAVLVFSILSAYNNALSGIQSAARQRAIVTMHSSMDAWMKVIMTLVVVRLLGKSDTSVVISYITSAFIVMMSQLLFLKRNWRGQNICISNNVDNWTAQMWKFSWPFCAWGIFTWAQQVSDRWALESFSSAKDIGQYAVVFQLGYTPIGMLSGLIMTLLGPILFQRSGGGADQIRNASVHNIVWRITQLSLVVTGVGFIITSMFHGQLFELLVAQKFRSVSLYLPWVVLAGGLFSAGQMLSLKLITEIRSSDLLYVKIGSAVIGIIANVLGAWIFGMAGVIVGLIIFSVTYLFWMIYLFRSISCRGLAV